jgi:hypothetical protein
VTGFTVWKSIFIEDWLGLHPADRQPSGNLPPYRNKGCRLARALEADHWVYGGIFITITSALQPPLRANDVIRVKRPPSTDTLFPPSGLTPEKQRPGEVDWLRKVSPIAAFGVIF